MKIESIFYIPTEFRPNYHENGFWLLKPFRNKFVLPIAPKHMLILLR